KARHSWPEVGQGAQEEGRRSPATWGVHTRVHHNSEEAELRPAQGRACAHRRLHRGHGIHSRRGPQPARALRGAGTRRSRQGPPWRSLQGGPRHTRRGRRERPQARSLTVRRKEEVASTMPRRAAAQVRPLEADPVHRSKLVQQIINKVMLDGKKSTAERIVYDALALLGERSEKDPVETLENAIKTLTPALEVRSRRVGGATYQVPVEVPGPR